MVVLSNEQREYARKIVEKIVHDESKVDTIVSNMSIDMLRELEKTVFMEMPLDTFWRLYSEYNDINISDNCQVYDTHISMAKREISISATDECVVLEIRVKLYLDNGVILNIWKTQIHEMEKAIERVIIDMSITP